MGVSEQENMNNESYEYAEISVSEQKRLESVKAKKEAFRAKEQAVKNALRNLDSKPGKNRIIFSDDIDEIPPKKVRKKDNLKGKKDKQKGNKNKNLFDNDDEEEDEAQPDWDCDDFQSKKATAKALASKYSFGNDKRFKLDERFLDDDETEKNEPAQEGDIDDLEKEKEWQLKLLGNVLGVPVAPKSKDAPTTKKSMIRYDPSQKDHQSYEITQEPEEPVKKTKKKKKEKLLAEAEEEKPVEVSKEIFFSVSENLTKSFKEGGGFSLLKTFGKEDLPEKTEEEYSTINNTKDDKSSKLKYNFNTKNPFKYDSSDGEDEDEGSGSKSSKKTPISEEPSHVPSTTDQFFFDANDSRFNEAVNFFSKEALPTNEFKNLRRELKQIVRAKIRNNVNKSQPWGGKKKIMNRPKQTQR